MAEIIIIPTILFCAAKTIGYGIFTLREQNISGAIMIFLMSILSAASIFALM